MMTMTMKNYFDYDADSTALFVVELFFIYILLQILKKISNLKRQTEKYNHLYVYINIFL